MYPHKTRSWPEHMHTLWPSSFTPRNIPNNNAYIYSPKDIYKTVNNNTILCDLQLKITQISLNGKMDKEIVIHSHSGTEQLQFSSVAQSCPTLCDPMNRSTPGLPVHHHLLEFTQTHVHRVRDAIQPSHPLSSPSPPAHNPSQHQSLFQWVSSSHEVANVLEFQL